jgi:hypothetical protein
MLLLLLLSLALEDLSGGCGRSQAENHLYVCTSCPCVSAMACISASIPSALLCLARLFV